MKAAIRERFIFFFSVAPVASLDACCCCRTKTWEGPASESEGPKRALPAAPPIKEQNHPQARISRNHAGRAARAAACTAGQRRPPRRSGVRKERRSPSPGMEWRRMGRRGDTDGQDGAEASGRQLSSRLGWTAGRPGGRRRGRPAPASHPVARPRRRRTAP